MGRLERASAEEGEARRSLLAGIVRERVLRHVADAIGPGVCSPEEATVLSWYSIGVPAEQCGVFMQAFAQLRRAFETRWGCRRDGDYQRTLARQYDAIAHRLVRPTRRAAATVYTAALRETPSAAAYLSWPRALATMMFGRGGRERAAAFKNRLGVLG
jgi:hypothetical protein